MADNESTLMIWVIILLIGLIVLILIGILNCYVPREQKIEAVRVSRRSIREEGDCVIELRQRINGSCMIAIALVVGVTSLASFIVENHRLIVSFFRTNEGLNLFLLIIIFLLIVGATILFLIVIPFALEEKTAEETAKYFINKYDVEVVDKRYTIQQ